MGKDATPPLIGIGMVTRSLSVPSRAAQLVKGIVEGYDGLGCVFAEHGGELTLAAPADREQELHALAHDLRCEFAPWTAST
jgi:hypothetical protein